MEYIHVASLSEFWFGLSSQTENMAMGLFSYLNAVIPVLSQQNQPCGFVNMFSLEVVYTIHVAFWI